MSPGHEGGLASSDGAAAEPGLHGKRVLLLFPHMVLPGGALNYMLKLAEILAGNGATVGILTLQVDRQKYEHVAGAELLTVGGPVTSSLGYWLFYPFWQMKINRMIREWHADVLVPQVFPANWWAWLYKRRHGDARQCDIDTAAANMGVFLRDDFTRPQCGRLLGTQAITVANFLHYITERKIRNPTFYRVVRTDNQPDNPVKIEVLQGGLTDVPVAAAWSSTK